MKATFNSTPTGFPAGTAAALLLVLTETTTGATIQARAAADATEIVVDFTAYPAGTYAGTLALVDGADAPLSAAVAADLPYVWAGAPAPSTVTFNVPTSLQLAD